MKRIRQFFAEVMRRRVFATTALYVLAAWAAIQVADLSIEAGLVPWSLRSVFIAAFLGFPVALVFAWFYDITRRGVVRTPPRGSTDTSGRRLAGRDYLLMASLVLVWAVANWVVYQPAPVDRSIAILPFENRGHDPEGADLAFGMRLDLHSQLAMLGDVRIIAMTSSDNVDASLPVAEIAEQLGAAFIMRGTVERVLDKFRVSVTLIDAKRDERAWSGTWDRQLDLASLFDIRDDLAAGITSSLRAALSPEEQERLQRRPTGSIEAYEAYLLGRQRMAKRATAPLAEAMGYFERSVELDPHFVLAWVGLAESRYLHMLYNDLSREEWLPRIDKAARRALELDRLSGEAHAILGVLADEYRGDDAAAERAFLRAIELSPGYATAYHWYGSFLSFGDREEQALYRKMQALELDPLSANTHLAVGSSLRALGRFEEALARFLKAIEIDPDVPGSYERVAEINHHVLGRLDEAVAWQMRGIARDPGDMVGPIRLGVMYLDLGDADEAEKWFDRAAAKAPPGHPVRTVLYEGSELRRGNLDRSAEFGRQMLDMEPTAPYSLLNRRNHELRAGRILEARALYERGHPELFGEDPKVDLGNYQAAIALVPVLIRNGEQALADSLLDRSEEVMRPVPRLGLEGYGISDALIHALRGQPDAAIRVLREAVDAGWRTNWWLYLDYDPAFDSMRESPGFQDILDEIRADMASQLANVRQMEANGQLPRIP